MKRDIENRADIELLVDLFYEKVKTDEWLGYIFNDMAKVNWQSHLPIMYNFWENIVLHTGSYEGNPMNLHKHLHNITPLHENHFAQWNKLFIETVNELFKGKHADLAISRAISIAGIMKNKILGQEPNKNIY